MMPALYRKRKTEIVYNNELRKAEVYAADQMSALRRSIYH